MLFLVAIANLFTKQIATIYGVSFTIVLFALFIISERDQRRGNAPTGKQGLEEFNLDHPVASRLRRPCTPAPAACWWRCATTTACSTCKRVLEKTNLRRHDIVVMTVRPLSTGAGEYELARTSSFSRTTKRNCSPTW